MLKIKQNLEILPRVYMGKNFLNFQMGWNSIGTKMHQKTQVIAFIGKKTSSGLKMMKCF
jgi:hypothetical protein